MGQGKLEQSSQIDFADSFVIANGETESTAVYTHGDMVTALHIPASFTGTSVSFKVASAIDGDYLPLHSLDGALYSVPVAAGTQATLDILIMATVNFLKVVSNSAEGAEREIVAVSQPL